MQNDREEHIMWEAFKKRDEEAFALLFAHFSDALFYYGCTLTDDRELIKDGIQELFCDLWERAEQCPEVQKVKYFLLAALRRILLRKLKRRQQFHRNLLEKHKEHNFPIAEKAISSEEAIIESEIKLEVRLQIKSAIEALPPRQREAIHLRYYQGLSYAEMAEVMKVQQSSVGHFISGAIKSLRQKIKHINFLLGFIFFFSFPVRF